MKTDIEALFASAAINKDGKANKEELKAVCVKLGMDPEEVSTIFNDIDKENSDSISLKEFIEWVFAPDEENPSAEATPSNAPAAEEDEEDEEDDCTDELDELPPAPKSTGARASVSAEAYGAWNEKKAFTPPVYEKTDDQKKRIQAVLMHSFLFQSLEKKDLDILLGAVEEEKVEAKHRIIKKGDDGDCMFIIESGVFKCYAIVDGEEKCVKTCE